MRLCFVYGCTIEFTPEGNAIDNAVIPVGTPVKTSVPYAERVLPCIRYLTFFVMFGTVVDDVPWM
jgi:hypothetical protein